MNNLKDIEIFSVGKWNKDNYTLDDLKSIVDAFNVTKKNYSPPLKLGHNNEQRLLKDDGLPAAGYVSKLYIKGEKLVADFSNIPKKIYELIKNKAYNRVSCEICWDFDIGNNKVFKRMLTAVALLGNQLPAVSNLKEIMSLYKLDFSDIKHYAENKNGLIIKDYESDIIIKIEDEDMPENNEDKVKGLEEKIIELTKDLEKMANENLLLKEKLKGQEGKEEEMENEEAGNEEVVKKDEEDFVKKEKEYQKIIKEQQDRISEIENDKFITELEKDNLLSPSLKPYINEILTDKKEYSIDKNKCTKKDIIKKILETSKSIYSVNLDESSESGDRDNNDDNEKALHEKIEKYASENNCSYSQAYKILTK